MDQASQPLQPENVTFRGIRLPYWLAVVKYWIDEFRSGVFSLKVVLKGIKRFEKEGKNCLFELSHVQFLFCKSRGISNYFFHWYLTRSRRRFLKFSSASKGLFQRHLSDNAATSLKKHGYFQFPERATEKTVQSLREVALQIPCYPREVNGHPGSLLNEARDQRLSVVYDYKEKDLVNHPAVQSFLHDPGLLETAQRYLGCQPILDLVTMWLSLPSDGKPYVGGAQAYHFDMDRFRWVKFFLYLNDVGELNGPHCFVRGTHKPFSIPWDILKWNYSRHSDEKIARHYSQKDQIQFTAPSGTLIAEDTKGLHKGRPLVSGERLIFEIEFTGHLFGALIEPIELLVKKDSEFETFVHRYPSIYRRYEIKNG